MGNYNANVDLEELKKWKVKADEELKKVEKVLEEVSAVFRECAGDDTIYGCFRKLGIGIADAWLGLVDTFKHVSDEADKLIKGIHKGVAKAVEHIRKFADWFHL